MARFAFTEEWMSLRASHILPYLARDHEIHYISSGPEKPKAEFASCTMFNFPRFQLQNSPRIAIAAWKLWRSGYIDFVVDYSYMAFLLPQVPFLEIVGGLYMNGFLRKWRESTWYNYPRLTTGYLHYCLPEYLAIRRARQIITDNAVNAEYMAEHYNVHRDNISIIVNGVDQRFDRLFLQKDWQAPRLLFVGDLHPRKGILAVLRTFHRRKELDVEFIVCGDGPDRDEIARLANDDRRIHYKGRVSTEELLAIEKKTSIFVFPSFSEGCPNALLEAMAAGHACVTYDSPTIIPTIRDCGLIAPLGDDSKIADLVAEVVHDANLRKNRAVAAHQCSLNYSWEQTARQVDKVINLMPNNY